MTRLREPDLEPPLVSHAPLVAKHGSVSQPGPALQRSGPGEDRHGADPVDAAGTAHRMADCLRAVALAMGLRHERDPLGLASAVTALFARAVRFDPADPHWPDRDRIVVGTGTGGEALLAAALELTGHGRPGASPAAVHLHDHPAAEAVPGPPGQALGVGTGMALAERLLAARFGRSLVDHRTWVLAASGDLAGGISHEAAALAGHLGLDRLAVLWDDDGSAGHTCSTDQLKRFAACGWTTRRVDGHDPDDLAAALVLALRSRKPTLIACMTAGAGHGSDPLPPHPGASDAPPDLAAHWTATAARGATARRGWKKRATRHALRGEFERVTAGRLPDGWTTGLRGADMSGSTASLGRQLAASLAPLVPELVGGTMGEAAGPAAIGPGRFGGQVLDHGARPHGMAAATAGLALHGGVLPYALGTLPTADALRPTLRLLAVTRQRAIHVLDDDGTQPEQVAALRTVPGLHVLRPADAIETAECWELALRRADGPSVLVLSGASAAVGRAETAENRCVRGGYVMAEADGPRQATLIASGAEVAVALQARAALGADGIAVAVVSLPCWELFAQLTPTEAAQILGDVPRAGIAAGTSAGLGDSAGWDRWLGPDGVLIAGPAHATPLTVAAVATAIRKTLPTPDPSIPSLAIPSLAIPSLAIPVLSIPEESTP